MTTSLAPALRLHALPLSPNAPPTATAAPQEGLVAPQQPTAPKTRITGYRRIEPNLLAPQLYTDALRMKFFLIDPPGAAASRSTVLLTIASVNAATNLKAAAKLATENLRDGVGKRKESCARS